MCNCKDPRVLNPKITFVSVCVLHLSFVDEQLKYCIDSVSIKKNIPFRMQSNISACILVLEAKKTVFANNFTEITYFISPTTALWFWSQIKNSTGRPDLKHS